MLKKTFRMKLGIPGKNSNNLGLTVGSLAIGALGLLLMWVPVIGYFLHNADNAPQPTVQKDGTPVEPKDPVNLGILFTGGVLFSCGVMGWRHMRRTQSVGRLVLSSKSVSVDSVSQKEQFNWDDVAAAKWTSFIDNPDYGSEQETMDLGGVFTAIAEFSSDNWTLKISLNSGRVVCLYGPHFMAPEKVEAALKTALSKNSIPFRKHPTQSTNGNI